jgi:hypothetical protein
LRSSSDEKRSTNAKLTKKMEKIVGNSREEEEKIEKKVRE